MDLHLPQSPELNALHAALPQEEGGGRPLRFRSADGVDLGGLWFEPPGPARAVAVIAPATGVPQRYYRPFAAWLARQGYATLSFDYRGMGASAPWPGAGMRDWVVEDLAAALDEAERRAAGRLPLVWVGHSLGGNGLPLVRGLERLDRVLTLGSQFGYWRLWDGWQRWVTAAFFKAWVPACVSLCGRLPGWALGGGEALPAQAALDWGRWGGSAGYYRDDPRCVAHYRPEPFRGQALIVSIDDDRLYGPPRAVDALADCLRAGQGRVERRHLRARDFGLRRLGHFGVFRREAAPRLWPELLRALEG